jgi:hypothetical protein
MNGEKKKTACVFTPSPNPWAETWVVPLNPALKGGVIEVIPLRGNI